MGPTPFYGARAKNPPFAHKANEYICRLSGDIKRQTQPRSSAGSRPSLPKFSGYVEVDAPDIFHPSTIWVRPIFTELGRKTPLLPIKQTNIYVALAAT